MTDQELNTFLIETLKKILSDAQECSEYVKNKNSEEYQEIKEDYDYTIKDIKDLLQNVKTIDDLADIGDDRLGDVFFYLESFTDNFEISQEPGQKEKDLAEYEKLEELLNLFYDEDEEE